MSIESVDRALDSPRRDQTDECDLGDHGRTVRHGVQTAIPAIIEGDPYANMNVPALADLRARIESTRDPEHIEISRATRGDRRPT